MKKFIYLLSFGLLFGFSTTFGYVENDEITDKIENDTQKENVVSKEELKYNTFKSCSDMGNVLEKYFNDNKELLFKNNFPYYRGEMMIDGMIEKNAVMEESTADMVAPTANVKEMGGAGDVDFSKTNNQVEGVEEPEIIKVDGEKIYYYNAEKSKIYIIQHPGTKVDNIDLDNVKILSAINIPKRITGVQMFLSNGKLAIIGNRYLENYTGNTFLSKDTKTTTIIYNVENKEKPYLEKMFENYGYFSDGRVIDGELYVMSNININYWSLVGEKFDNIKDKNIEINNDDLLPIQTEIYLDRGDKKNPLIIKNKELPYEVSVGKVKCDNIYYMLPNKETLEKYNFNLGFYNVTKINLKDITENVKTNIVFGNTQNIHVSTDNIYLVEEIYSSNRFACPFGARCMMPFFESNNNSLIHKFSLGNDYLDYVDTNIVSGVPLSQYSMSEDNKGNFRILTKQWSPELDTNLFILDEELNLEGKLNSIQKNEEFKSSRYIGDKLYLVTFERTDPLFVIDLKDTKNPKILGELKIPGYSTYLHPYMKENNGIQYIIGLGYDTKENEFGGIVNAGVKVDLYKIDYTKSPITIKQTGTKTFGDKGSYTEALDNPRMFVWNEKTKELTLPILLQDVKTTKRCTENYYYEDGKKVVDQNEYCWDQEEFNPTFVGLYNIKISESGNIEVINKKDYKETILKEKDYFGGWEMQNLGFRAGYIGNNFYLINNYFVDFINKNNNENIVKNFD